MEVNDRESRRQNCGAIAFGSGLILVGAVFLMENWGLVGVRLWDLWPIALIAIGLEGLLKRGSSAKS